MFKIRPPDHNQPGSGPPPPYKNSVAAPLITGFPPNWPSPTPTPRKKTLAISFTQ